MEFVEPFAGGAAVGLTAAFEDLADKVTLVERDEQVAAVWRTILCHERDWLIDQICDFEMSEISVLKVLNSHFRLTKKKAFQALLKNRVNRGGIMAPGSGLLKNGENGRGLKSRWYPETLARRIQNIGCISSQVKFIEGNGLDVLRDNAHREDVVYFIDPPYTAAGKKPGVRLYKYSFINHRALFSSISRLRGDFLLTYNDSPEVIKLAHAHKFDVERVPMRNTHHERMTELLIGRNLRWARS